MAGGAAKKDAAPASGAKADESGAKLVALNDQAAAYGLSSGRLSIGSAPENDVVIADPTVSKRHALIRRRFGRIRVTDLDSTNGTFVDGRRVRKSARVERGAELRFGAVRFALVAPPLARVPFATIAALSIAVFAAAFAVTYHQVARKLAAELSVAEKARLAAVAEAERATVEAPTRAWLAQLNHYRALAKLKPVVEDRTLSDGDGRHAEYLVKTHATAVKSGVNLGADAHTQDRNSPWYSNAGRAAAEASNVAQSSLPPAGYLPPSWAIDFWMEGPFHRLPMLNPGLTRVGYGESCGDRMCAAGLNVNAGARAASETGVWFDDAIMFPPDGSMVALLQLDREWPDPLSACAGYQKPVGLPVTLQVGEWIDARLSSYSITNEGAVIETCGFDATSYTSPDEGQQKLVRDILKASGAVVVVPRRPLRPGATYSVSMTVEGHVYRWAFLTAR
jgi:uncharacterized protein YkwD